MSGHELETRARHGRRRRRPRALARAAGAASGLVLAAVVAAGCGGGSATPAPGFSSTGPMSVSRLGHSAALVAGGRVLIAGGYSSGGPGQLLYLDSAELYDPDAGTFRATGSMTARRAGAPATVLQDGRVLIAGGYSVDASGSAVPIASAELYDPASGTFSATGSMAAARYNHSATLLTDGLVLIAGGTGDGATLASAELYDPGTGAFIPAGPMTTERVGQTAALLQDGRVLIVGGARSSGSGNVEYLASAELYDPAANAFVGTGQIDEARYRPVAVRLVDGRVLIAGGMRLVDPASKVSLASAELFDAAGTSSASTGSMGAARTDPAWALLRNGRVLMAGGMVVDGSSAAAYPASAELYDPATGTFVFAGSMSGGRVGATATLLNNGQVLIAGGGDADGTLATAELYQP